MHANSQLNNYLLMYANSLIQLLQIMICNEDTCLQDFLQIQKFRKKCLHLHGNL